MPKLRTEIPPWALPLEEITMYIKLQKKLDISKISIQLPDYFEIKDRINVEDSKQHNNIIDIFKISKSHLSEYDYFGITIASTTPFDDLAVRGKILLSLHELNGNITKYEEYARIFRPLLTIDRIPDEISLNDGRETTLPIHLKFEGFGHISFRIEASVDGILVSEGVTSVMDRIFQAFLHENMFDDHAENIQKKGISINRTKLIQDLDEVKNKLQDPEYLKQIYDGKITSKGIEWLQKLRTDQQEKFMGVFYDTMENYMIKKIADISERNVGKHLQLDFGTNIKTSISTELTNLRLRIFYRDLAKNIYQPLETAIRIRDKRKNESQVRVTIPIEIAQVDESKAYSNVEKMEIKHVC